MTTQATILDYYKYAVLATASYVRVGPDVVQPVGPQTAVVAGDRFAAVARDQGRLPLPIGQFLFDPANKYGAPTWNISYYYGGDAPGVNDTTGFAATLFERNGEKVLALRGTEPTEDSGVDLWQADIGAIGVLGMSLPQIVSMVNLIQRLKGKLGAPVLQLQAHASLTDPGVPSVVAQGTVPGTSVYLYFTFYTASGLEKISDTDKVTFTRHSLGGHLAAFAARLFPDIANPDVYLFNAAGFDPVTANAPILNNALTGVLAPALGASALNLAPKAQQLSGPLTDLIGSYLAVPAARDFLGFQIHSLASEDLAPGDDVSIVNSSLTGAQNYGPKVTVPTEANSHLIEPFMDSLALQALLYSMNKDLTFSDITRLLEAASNKLETSEERLTEALFRFFFKDQALPNGGTELPVSDATGDLSSFFGILGKIGIGKGEINARAAFYEAVLRIQDALKTAPQPITLKSLVDVSRDELVTRAQASNGLAYRYALSALNPFAVLGPDALYAQHDANGSLDLYNPSGSTPTGMTNEYLTDRAAMLAWINLRNVQDLGSLMARDDVTEATEFQDRASKQSIRVFPANVSNGLGPYLEPREILFGADGPDVLTGGTLSDRLYGGAGTDYLEGGAGLDVYNYNAGTTLGLSNSNDGADTLRDTDGRGVLRYTFTQSGVINDTAQSTVIAEAAVKLSDTQWQSADGHFTYTKVANAQGGTDLVVSINGDAGGSLTLKDFHDGDYDIRLWQGPANPQISRNIFGDRQALDTDPSTPEINIGYDDLGNVKVTDEVVQDKADTLYGDRPQTFDPSNPNPAGEKFDAGGGNDIILADRPKGQADNGLGNADWILGGAAHFHEFNLGDPLATPGHLTPVPFNDGIKNLLREAA